MAPEEEKEGPSQNNPGLGETQSPQNSLSFLSSSDAVRPGKEVLQGIPWVNFRGRRSCGKMRAHRNGRFLKFL